MTKLMHKVSIPIFFLVLALTPVAAPGQGPAVLPEAAPSPAPPPPLEDMSVTARYPISLRLAAHCPLASVDDEVITMDDLYFALKPSPDEVSGEEGGAAVKAPPQDPAETLRRLVNVQLVLFEATEMGLADQPEIGQMVKANSRILMREVLMDKTVRDVKPDPKVVEEIYKSAITQFRIKSVRVFKEEDKKNLDTALKSGKSIEDASEGLIADKKAEGGGEAINISEMELTPMVKDTVLKLKPGQVSAPIKDEKGFVYIKLEGVKSVEDKDAKVAATRKALGIAKVKALRDMTMGMVKKEVKLKKKVIKGIDYQAKKPGFAAYMKDARVVAEIRGEKPITVSELTAEIQQGLYHGVQMAAEGNKLNAKKDEVLNDMIFKRLMMREAKRRGIEKTDDYRDREKSFRDSLVFGSFVQKAVIPSIKVPEKELKKYYDDHVSDYTYPEMIKLYSLAFQKVAEAEGALDKLKKGTDFGWMKANAEGLVPDTEEGALKFDGDVLSTKALPGDIAKALSGAAAGDYRMYAGPDNRSYVLLVKEVTPSKVQPYLEVKEAITKKVFGTKINEALKDWIDKLSKAHRVKIYATSFDTK